MKKNAVESKFEEYREYLRIEVQRLVTYTHIYRRLYKHRRDRLDAMNLAPCFFGTVTDALFSVIIIWVEKLLSQKSERGLLNLLEFVQRNLKLFVVSELKRRRQYPNGHWMLDRDDVSIKTIQEDRERIKRIDGVLDNIRHRRDKFHAHFDKEYFFDRRALQKEAPIRWADLEDLVQVMTDILNRYSAAYDGNTYSFNLFNEYDVDGVLDVLHEHVRAVQG